MQKHLDIAADLFYRLRDRVRGTSARLSGEILAVTGEMDDFLKRVEPDFLGLGDMFQEAQKATALFINDVILAIESIKGGEGHAGLTGVNDLASGFVLRLDSHRHSIARSVDSFDQVIRDLTHVPRICEKADRVALLLRVIALNIGIESQGLGQARDTFTAFVEEVYALSDHMKDLSGRLSRDSRSLHKKHSRTLTDVKAHVDRLEDLARDARKGMDVSSVNVQRLMETALEAMEEVGEAMRHITAKAGEIVIAMQFHDIIRQKIEHMISAMADAAGLINPGSRRRSGASDRQQAQRILMVQVAQIDEIKKEIHGANQSITRALESIDGDVGDIYRHISSQGLRSEQHTSDDPFRELLSSMESLKNIQLQALELGGRVHRYMEEASTAASDLTGHLEAVEHIRLDLHRKALNAIVKAAHLGEKGKGIEVFAQEVNQASLETRTFAHQVSTVVGDVCSRTGDSLRTGTATDEKAMEEDRFSTGLEFLSQAYETFNGHINAMATRFEEIEAVLGQGRNSLDFLDGFVRDMDAVQVMIGSIAERLSPTSQAETADAVRPMVDHRYTMASERLVHERVLGRLEYEAEGDDMTQSMSEESRDAAPEDDSSGDDFGDNVELF